MSPRAIAIVGAAGRFPGAPGVSALWDNVLACRSAARATPAERWPVAHADMLDAAGSPDRARSASACTLEPFTLDERGLELPPELLARLSPLAKLTLQVGAEAFANAGLGGVERARIGVVLANIALPTDGASKLAEELFMGALDRQVVGRSSELTVDPLERHPSALPAGLLARALALGGGTFTLDAACASSLYALHLACAELEAARLDAVLVGGVSLPQALYTQVGFTQLQALSASGRCAPFDARADGLVVGEGAGMFVLQRLEDAEPSRVRAVIRGIGLSNDVGGSLLAPDSEGQLRALRAAYAQAGWAPDDVNLVECHGTGTPRGDAVELASLTKLWEDSERRGCVLGSVKSNVGHLLTAAGAAGLCKVLAAFDARTLPPTAGFATASAALEASPFRVLATPEPWLERAPGRPRRAGISGFGFGGINAHLLLEEGSREALARATGPRAESASSRERQRSERSVPVAGTHRVAQSPVAIVGMAAHFGRLDSLAAFQRALLHGEPVLDARPAERWLGLDGPAQPGAWLSAFDLPADRFRIPPRELASLLPQQLLTLKVAAEALDDAGGLGAGPHLRAGAVIGLGLDLDTTSFQLRWLVRARVRRYAAELGLTLTPAQAAEWEAGLTDALAPALDATRTLGALGGIVASRVARELKLGGPSFAVCGEEGSGLRALEVATRMLQRGEVDWMLAGAVDLAGDVRQVLATDALRPYSRRGRATPFDRAADGPTLGEGAAAVALKRLDDAVRDGDRIYAVVRGLGVAGGAALAPGRARSDVYAQAVALARAEAGPGAIALLAAHGSGDPAEDRDEAEALARSFGRAEGPRCALTSAAAVIGQAGAAGSLASAIAAALCLHHEIIAPLPGFVAPAAGVALAESGFHVVREPQPWLRDRADGPRRAGVSAMGFDGTCVHAVLEGNDRATSRRPESALGERSAALFLCRGDEGALRALAATHTGPFEALGARWHQRGSTGAVTRACVASDVGELLRQLERPPVPPVTGELAFVFPGSGNHYAGMGRSLALALPSVVRALDAETQHLRGQMMQAWLSPWRASWSEGWEAEAARELARAPERVLLAQVAHGILVHDAVRLFGVRPHAYLGYSLGESAALFASRTWRDRDRMFHRTLASPLFRTELAGARTLLREHWGEGADWRVVVVNRPAGAVRRALAGTAALLIVNAPEECVVGGTRADVARTVAALGCEALALESVPTVHLPLVRAVAAAYRELHHLPADPPPGVRFYSCAWARAYVPSADAAADSILANAVGGFDFRATVEQAYADGVRVFLELGPQGSCTRMIARILGERPHLAVTACQRGQDGFRALLVALARLAEAGVALDLAPIYGGAPEATSVHSTVSIAVGGRRPAPPPVPRAPADPTEPADPTAAAHEAFLHLAQRSLALQAQALLEQQRLLARLHEPADRAMLHEPIALDRAMCLEHATGSLARVLGPDFAEVDRFPTRVRLPAEPLMLVDRIVTIEGARGELGAGRCVTEHDVLAGAWYLDGGRAPVCISVEAGQADLFLCAYLGIDRRTRGERVYRLLDAKIVFHRELPRAGERIRYDIRIDRFIQQGDTWLFFFRFDGTIAGAPFITMFDGCAGFFSREQLESGRGIVASAPRARSPQTPGLLPYARTTLDERALDALRTGDLGAAFAEEPAFAGRTLCPSLRLPGGRMRLVDRILELDPGAGVVHAEADVTPDAWYLECHFVDDPVMPGTLMYECCLHTLRVLLLRLGWVAEGDTEVHCEPIAGVTSTLRCRGQVTPETRKVSYRVEIEELGYDPEPYVRARASMFADGRHVVEMEGMSLRLRGLTRAALEATWSATSPLHMRAQIVAYAEGNPSEAFGERYRPFDETRRLARLPRDPYLFMDRVLSCANPPWVLEPGGWTECELDVVPGAWYFAANRQRAMPFAVVLEAALQPCGWLAAYLGAALLSDEELCFRNLDGTATAFAEVGPDSGTLTMRTRLTEASQAGGMILVGFDIAVNAGARRVYEGTTGFGFFTRQALAQQVGIRGARLAELPPNARAFTLPREAPFTPGDPTASSTGGLALSAQAFSMIDRIDALALDGGAHGLGFVAGTKRVDAREWFFAAHFFQDPVMPGSLGLEALLQVLKVYARERFGRLAETHRFQATALGVEHRWQYRGQVVSSCSEVQVQATLTRVLDGPEPVLVADGLLAVDGRVIYAMKDLSLRLVRGEA